MWTSLVLAGPQKSAHWPGSACLAGGALPGRRRHHNSPDIRGVAYMDPAIRDILHLHVRLGNHKALKALRANRKRLIVGLNALALNYDTSKLVAQCKQEIVLIEAALAKFDQHRRMMIRHGASVSRFSERLVTPMADEPIDFERYRFDAGLAALIPALRAEIEEIQARDVSALKPGELGKLRDRLLHRKVLLMACDPVQRERLQEKMPNDRQPTFQEFVSYLDPPAARLV